MTIFSSKHKLIAKCLFYYEDHQVMNLIQKMLTQENFIYFLDFLKKI